MLCIQCNKRPIQIPTQKICKACYLRNWIRTRSNNSPKIECACGCGELIPLINSKGIESKYKNHHNTKPGNKSPNWKGGRHINSQGYQLIYAPTHPFRDSHKCVRFHRYIKEIYLSILNGIPTYIHPSLDVDHKDNNKLNNSLNNLQIISHSDHLKRHYNLRKKDMYGRLI